jgi:DNA-binding transcriptional MocR family regulator
MTGPRLSIIPAAAVLDPDLEPRDLQVLCLFGRHTDENGWCTRSQVKLAAELGCARSTVQASIERLVEAGWLQKRSDKDEVHAKGKRTPAFDYRVVLDTADQTQPMVAEGADLSAGGADLERQGVPTYASAPKNDYLLNEKKEARTRVSPTEGLAVVAADSEDFRAITKLREGRRPYVGQSGSITVKASELAAAREKFGVAA